MGALQTTDPDANNTFTYTLVTGTGSTDNAKFSIRGNTLSVMIALDFEYAPMRSIRVRTTDQGGLSFEKSFTITVTYVVENPPIPVPIRHQQTNTIEIFPVFDLLGRSRGTMQ